MKQITKLLKETIITLLTIDVSNSPYPNDEDNKNKAIEKLQQAFILVDDEMHAIDALYDAEDYVSRISFYDSSEEDDIDVQDTISSQIREVIYLVKEKAAE